MESTETPTITKLLEEIEHKSDLCLQNNEYISFQFRKICWNLREGYQSRLSHLKDDLENNLKNIGIEYFKDREKLDPLETILLEKLHENSRLQTLNERLLTNSQQKSHKIKELEREVSLHGAQSENDKEISRFRDEIGRHNVEIQKLKKQISLETKKLQSEKMRIARQSKNRVAPETSNREKLTEGTNKSIPTGQNFRKNKNQQQNEGSKTSIDELDKACIQKTLKLIKQSEEGSIYDETLDMPENLDLETDEEVAPTGEVSGNSSDVDVES